MIVTFTDFGSAGPYLGQMEAVLHRALPTRPVVCLMSDAPMCNPKASAYLLAALASEFPAGTVFLCVVDPGVGGDRKPLAVQADGHWYVGPDNGLFELLLRRHPSSVWDITWRPERLSSTFHGRDLFAPVAAKLAAGVEVGQVGRPIDPTRFDWPDDLAEVVYIDHYGNAMTGVTGRNYDEKMIVTIPGRRILHAERFDTVQKGQPFWYVNSCGLIEIAVNQGRADKDLNLNIGSGIAISAV